MTRSRESVRPGHSAQDYPLHRSKSVWKPKSDELACSLTSTRNSGSFSGIKESFSSLGRNRLSHRMIGCRKGNSTCAVFSDMKPCYRQSLRSNSRHAPLLGAEKLRSNRNQEGGLRKHKIERHSLRTRDKRHASLSENLKEKFVGLKCNGMGDEALKLKEAKVVLVPLKEYALQPRERNSASALVKHADVPVKNSVMIVEDLSTARAMILPLASTRRKSINHRKAPNLFQEIKPRAEGRGATKRSVDSEEHTEHTVNRDISADLRKAPLSDKIRVVEDGCRNLGNDLPQASGPDRLSPMEVLDDDDDDLSEEAVPHPDPCLQLQTRGVAASRQALVYNRSPRSLHDVIVKIRKVVNEVTSHQSRTPECCEIRQTVASATRSQKSGCCRSKQDRKFQPSENPPKERKVLLSTDKCGEETISVFKISAMSGEAKLQADFLDHSKPRETKHNSALKELNGDLQTKVFDAVDDKCGVSLSVLGQLLPEKASGPKKSVTKSCYCTICGKGFSRVSSLNVHLRTHSDEKPYQCTVCGKSFKVKFHLERHNMSHTGEKPLHCSVCGKGFALANHLHRHEMIHTGERPHRCLLCGKSFVQASDLRRHHRTHTEEMPFRCDVCGKRYREKGSLQVHQRCHRGEKPYQCSICKKRFTYYSAFHNHMKVHSDEKPFECDVCHKAFSRINKLREHKLIHTGQKPFKCETCHLSFRQASALNAHVLTHSGLRPYTCDFCGRKFREKAAKVIHERTHTGEKPFRCKMCGKAFCQKTSLYRHWKVEHGGIPNE